MRDKIKVALVEDDPDFVFLIQKLIVRDERLDFAGSAGDGDSGVELARKQKPDIVLMDLNLSGGELDGIEAAKNIRLTTCAKVLLLTSFERPDIIISASKRAFASGYIFKSQCGDLAEIIFQTASGHTPQERFIRELLLGELSQAERSVLDYLLAGEGDAPPPSSAKTIANQKTSIFRKLGIKSSGELTRVFRE